MNTRLKSLCVNLLLSAGATAAGLALVEGAVRLFVPQPPIAEWFTRDAELAPLNAADGKTLLLLGDSFVFGYGVNVEERLDAHLRARCGGPQGPLRVINAGVPGWGTRNETQFARDHFEDFKPDCVLLVFCGNDPDNDLGLQLPVLANEESTFYLPKLWLRQHVHAYRWLLGQWAGIRHARRVAKEARQVPPTAIDPLSGSAISPEAWDRTLGLIRAFHADFQASKPGGLLVLAAADPDHAETRAHLGSLDNGGTLRYLDLAAAFAELAPEARVTPWDRHWSPAAHRRAAEALATLLAPYGLCPS